MKDNVLLIAGTGAVKNSWKPIIKAIQEDYAYEIDQDVALSFLCNLVYTTRFVFQKKEKEKDLIELSKTNIDNYRRRICIYLSEAQKNNEIEIRNEFEIIVKKFIFEKGNSFIVVNVNWDTVVDEKMKVLVDSFKGSSSNLIVPHIHGSIEDYKSLYMPSEITHESYREDDNQLESDHIKLMTTLTQTCNVLIIYGLSLDPLDAELSFSLSTINRNAMFKEIYIIDPNPEIVKKRLLSNFNKQMKMPKITTYTLKQLEQL